MSRSRHETGDVDRDHADNLLRGTGWSDNDFDGRRTRRVYSLLNRVGPADNHILATGVDQLRSLTPALRRLAAVAPASDYLGFVAGQDPEQWLRQTSSD